MTTRNRIFSSARIFNRGTLVAHDLFATGTTGSLLESELKLDIHKLLSARRDEFRFVTAL